MILIRYELAEGMKRYSTKTGTGIPEDALRDRDENETKKDIGEERSSASRVGEIGQRKTVRKGG